MLDHGADVNCKPGEVCPLEIAVLQRNIVMLRLLLEAGADVNRRSGFFGSPFLCAIHRGNVEIVKMFLGYGADMTSESSNHSNPLLWSFVCGRKEITRLLLKGIVDIQVTSNGMSVSYLMAKEGMVHYNDKDTCELLKTEKEARRLRN